MHWSQGVCSLLLVLWAALSAEGMLFAVKNMYGATAIMPEDAAETVRVLALMMDGDRYFTHGLREHLASNKNFNFCSWVCVTCNEKNEMIGITLQDVEGTINFGSVPKSVTTLVLLRGSYNQPLDFTSLSPNVKNISITGGHWIPGVKTTFAKNSQLEAFSCSMCSIKEIDWSTIPDKLTHLDLSYNSLGGLPSLEHGTLTHLNLSHCSISAHLNTLKLPAALETLDLSHNALTGTFSEIQLPASLKHLSLADNKLEGDFKEEALPANLEILDISQNRLSGTLSFKSKLRTVIR